MCWMEIALSRGNKDGVSNPITLDSHSYTYRDTHNITVENMSEKIFTPTMIQLSLKVPSQRRHETRQVVSGHGRLTSNVNG